VDSVWQSLVTVIILLAVIFAAYYFTKILAGRAMTGHRRTQQIQVIDTFYLSRDKIILLVTVAETAYLIGVSNQAFSLLDSFDASKLPAKDPDTSGGVMPGLMNRLGKMDFKQWSRAGKGRGGFRDFFREAEIRREQEELDRGDPPS